MIINNNGDDDGNDDPLLNQSMNTENNVHALNVCFEQDDQNHSGSLLTHHLVCHDEIVTFCCAAVSLMLDSASLRPGVCIL